MGKVKLFIKDRCPIFSDMELKKIENDFELISSFVDGNEKSFNELIRRYQKLIYWHARRMVGNHFDADEVTQQVIIVLYNKLVQFNFNSSVKTWIYKITSTRSLNLLKKRKIRKLLRIDEVNKTDLLNSDDIYINFENRERIEEIDRLLIKLPAKQREVFILRHFEGLSYREISAIMNKSVGTLKANYFHASKKILGNMKNE